MKQNMTGVSIIIVNWNTCDILSDCLVSIYEQTENVEFEVIVIDNNSGDASVEVIKKKFPQVRLIENSVNRGFAAANNQGIATAKGRYVLLLNSDTIVLDNAIAKTVRFADTYPEAAVVGCRVLNPDRTLQPTCFMFPSLLNMLLSSSYLYKVFPNSRFFGRERMSRWARDNVREIDVVTGCFMLIRREAIDQVGVMDERFFMYGEETDWCYRFTQAGWRVVFTPGAEIVHLRGASSRQIKPEMRLQLSGSILLFLKKHRRPLEYRLGCFLVALFFLVRIPYWLGKAIILKIERKKSICIVKTYITGFFASLIGFRSLCIKNSYGCVGEPNNLVNARQ